VNTVAKKYGFEVLGEIPATLDKKPNFSSTLSKNYTVVYNEKEKVTKRELTEFLDSVPEDASGKKPSMNWVRGQKKYIKYKVQEEEANYFSLTPLGKRVLKVSTVNG
jgi:hypothetical protein